ncbi:MAG: hypothetical protein F4064_15950, partial [Acidimicrobiales bacterium]|nr:hypothetical protein [Acidimicrobiales bacterium]MYI29560.1 hypothetical protein [Acidimicrobiales bacterium]
MQLRDASLGRYLKEPEQQYSQIDVSETVSEILADISTGGIDAVRRYSRQFDNWDPPSFRVTGVELREAQSAVEPRLVAQIDFALQRIRSFAAAQKDCIQPLEAVALVVAARRCLGGFGE